MQFRFAAIESVEPEKRPSATAVVLLGGLISAFLGTEVATLGKNYFETDFVGSFVLLAFLFVIAFIKQKNELYSTLIILLSIFILFSVIAIDNYMIKKCYIVRE